MARASTAFIFLALIAAAGHVDANTRCGIASRGCNAPEQFSGMKKSTTLPTIVASTGITDDFKAKLNEGHQVLINFAGGASTTYAYSWKAAVPTPPMPTSKPRTASRRRSKVTAERIT